VLLASFLPCFLPPAPARAQASGTPEFPAAQVDTLTLEAAVQRTLSSNPGLRAASLEVDARTALARQAARLPNPTLETEAENVGSSGAEAAVLTASIAQLVELGGDRGARRRLASREADLARTDAAAARIDYVRFARVRFAEAAAAQARLNLAETAEALARRSLEVTAEQVDAGDRSPVDETRAELQVAEASAERASAAAERTAAFARLAALWAAEPDFSAVEALPVPEPLPEFDTLDSRLTGSAALALWSIEVDRREAALRLERAQRIPDLTLSAGYRRFSGTGDRAFVGVLSLPLPLFSTNRGGTSAARSRLLAAEADRDAAAAAARADLAAVYGEAAAAYAESVSFRDDVLPRAEDVVARIEEGYREGKFALLDVLDAQRTLADARARYAGALAAFHIATAEIERLTTESPGPFSTP
jgi:cobalt-zinc-cadmium efflux system outer membrane protein